MSVTPTSSEDTSQTGMISLPNPTKTFYTEHSSDNDMTTTFADYCATADAREQIAANVLKWTEMLCEALEHDYIEESIRRQKFRLANETGNVEVMTKVSERIIAEIKDRKDTYQFVIETGRKYHKIVMVAPMVIALLPAVSTHLLTRRLVKSTWQHHGKHLLRMECAMIFVSLSSVSMCLPTATGQAVISTSVDKRSHT